MGQGSFQRIEKTDERMYGPRKLLACGYRANEQDDFLNFLKQNGFSDLPVIFVYDDLEDMTLEELMEKPNGTGVGENSGLKRAAILSGFTHEEIHRILSRYREAGFPRQLWATLTPVSKDWKISSLLKELEKEAEEVKRQGSR